MELVIPRRRHENQQHRAARYTYDEHGQAIQVTPFEGEDFQPQVPPRVFQERFCRGPQTIQWPFQSVLSLDTGLSTLNSLGHSRCYNPSVTTPTSTAASIHIARRVTCRQPSRLKLLTRASSGTNSVERDLIPDYVVNYLRGETASMVARRKRNGGKLGERAVELVQDDETDEPGQKPRQDSRLRHQRSQAGQLVHLGDDGHEWWSETSSHAGNVREKRGTLQGQGKRKGPGSGVRWLEETTDAVEKRRQGRKRKRRWAMYAGVGIELGWRVGVGLHALLCLFVLLVTGACLAWAAATGRLAANPLSIFEGSCATAERLNHALQGVASVLGMVVLVAGHYAFQVLSSPTRKEVDRAHAQSQWLEIGVPSVRNLSYISKGRAGLAVVVGATALVMPVILNAVIFTSGPSVASGSCTLNLNGPLLGTAAVLSVVAGILLTSVLYSFHSDPESSRSPELPLVTLGDAYASFLHNSDPQTLGNCLLTKDDVLRGCWSGRCEPRYFSPGRFDDRWLRAVSTCRWLFFALIWAVVAGLAAAGLALALQADRTQLSTTLAPKYDIYLPASAAAFIAALPQLLLALLYMSTNGVLTCFFLTRESARFALSAHPLRRSVDSTLYLTLPRPVSWLLSAFFVAAIFSVSRAARAVGLPDAESPTLSLGLDTISLTALLGGLIFLAITILATGFLGRASNAVDPAVNLAAVTSKSDADVEAQTLMKRVRRGNPLALTGGPCSAVMSARCHRLPGVGDLWSGQPVVWGVAPELVGTLAAHAAFTSGEAARVRAGVCYA